MKLIRTFNFYFYIGNAKKRIGIETNVENQLDNIKLDGKILLKQKIILNENEKLETLRIYATDEMLDVLEDKNYTHFFLDGTFKCVPKGSKFIYTSFFIFYNK